jgi:hypothetical protein
MLKSEQQLELAVCTCIAQSCCLLLCCVRAFRVWLHLCLLLNVCAELCLSVQGFRAAREAAKAKAGPVPQTKAAAQRALPTGRGDGGGRGGGRGGGGGQQQQQRYGQRGSANAGAAAMAAANRQGGSGGGQLRSERSQWLALIETLRKGWVGG